MKPIYRDYTEGKMNDEKRTYDVNMKVLKRQKNQEAIKDFLENVDKEELLKTSFLYCNHKEPGIRLLCLCGLAFCNDNFSALEQSNKLLDLITDYLELQLDYAKKNKQRASDFVLHHANRQTDARQNAANIQLTKRLMR